MSETFTMFKNSIWWPGDARRGVLLLSILFLIVIRQNEIFGLMDSTMLVFGWFPIQLAFDTLLGIIAVVIAYGFYRAAPEPDLEEIGESDVSADTTASGGDD